MRIVVTRDGGSRSQIVLWWGFKEGDVHDIRPDIGYFAAIASSYSAKNLWEFFNLVNGPHITFSMEPGEFKKIFGFLPRKKSKKTYDLDISISLKEVCDVSTKRKQKEKKRS